MRALYICGSLNQTKMMHRIAMQLSELESFFTPYFCDGFLRIMQRIGAAEFTVLGGRFRMQTLRHLERYALPIDPEGQQGNYELVVTCSDLVVPRATLKSKLVLVQEGMTDPETVLYTLVKRCRFPRWIAHTASTSLSDAYQLFCVASEGYKELFQRKGVRAEKIRVTGIPNFDDCQAFVNNDFPYRDYLLVATSDRRETYKYENRRMFIHRAQQLADGRFILFKFHPNEDPVRAEREVAQYAPGALAYADANTDHMIANCHSLLTRYSSVVFVALALDKTVYCDLPLEQLRKLLPMQNNGRSAANIAAECRALLGVQPKCALPSAQSI